MTVDTNITNLTQVAYQQLKQQIIEGRLQQGSAFSISAMARELNISRTPVTHACIKLEHDRLVTIMPKQGVVINSVSVIDAREIYELRAAVEFYSALRSFDLITDEIKQKLHQCYDKQVAHIHAGNTDGFMVEDLNFHKIILSVLKNSQFMNIIDSMREKAHLLGIESLKSTKRQQENLDEHKMILDQMNAGDKLGFAQAIETNILNGLASLTSETYYT